MGLTDLRVLHDRFDVEAVNQNTRSARVSDLVEALQAEGVGEVVEVDGSWTTPARWDADLKSFHRKSIGSGRYLLVALDTLGEDA